MGHSIKTTFLLSKLFNTKFSQANLKLTTIYFCDIFAASTNKI